MSRKIDHIAIAVKSLAEALRIYESVLGVSSTSVEEVTDQKTRVALLPMGDSDLELIEPLADDSHVGRFLAKRGEGLHHLCIQVDDIQAEMARLREAGVRLIDDTPRHGAHGCLVAFVHPSSTAGVLIELSQSSSRPAKPISG